jgi:hypothetical protein
MNAKETAINRLYRISRELKEITAILNAIPFKKPRADKKHSSNAERQKAYRQRKTTLHPSHVDE